MSNVLKLTLSDSQMSHIEKKRKKMVKKFNNRRISRQDVVYDLIDKDIAITGYGVDTFTSLANVGESGGRTR